MSHSLEHIQEGFSFFLSIYFCQLQKVLKHWTEHDNTYFSIKRSLTIKQTHKRSPTTYTHMKC